MENTGRVPTQSVRNGQSMTVHSTREGRAVLSTWITSGSGVFMKNSRSPPVLPLPSARTHHAASPAVVVIASNTVAGVDLMRTTFA
jgi:hypothetical protein